MKIIHKGSFKEHELAEYRLILYDKVLESPQQVVNQSVRNTRIGCVFPVSIGVCVAS